MLDKDSVSRTLTGGTADPDDSDVQFDINLNAADLNFIKKSISFGTTENSTYISLTPKAVKDMSGNEVVEITAVGALKASTHVIDNVAPALAKYSFDLDNGVVTLTFSETVKAASIKSRFFTFSSSALPSAKRVTLTGGSVSTTDSTVISITLTKKDLNALKADPVLAVSSASTYVSHTSGAVVDMNDIEIAALPLSSALAAGQVLPDETDPEL